MQVPIDMVMGLASGAVGLLQKVLVGGGDQKANEFEALLQSSLQARGGAVKGVSLKNLFSAAGTSEEDLLAGLAALPDLKALFGQLSVLMNLGLNVKDLQAIADGKGLSDEALTSLLKSLGGKAQEIGRILADEGGKEHISKTLQDMLNQAGHKAGVDVSALLEGYKDRPDDLDKLLAQLEGGRDLKQGAFSAPPAVHDETVNSLVQALERLGVTVAASQRQATLASQTSTSSMEDVLKVMRNTLGLDEASVRDLVLSTDENVRQQALEKVQSAISAYLAANGERPLRPEVLQALGVLKAALSDQEFARLDQLFKAWQPTLSLPQTEGHLRQELMSTLTARFGGSAAEVFDQQVNSALDQLRRAVPAQLKNGEGSVMLRLNPPILGRVNVNISMEEGGLNATFKTEQAFTRDMLQQNMHVLREALAEQGIRVTSVSVSSGLFDRPAQDGSAAWGDQGRFQGGTGQSGRHTPQGAYTAEDETLERRYDEGSLAALMSAGGLDLIV